MSAHDLYYTLGRSIGWVMPNEKEACDAIIEGEADERGDDRASFLAGHRATRIQVLREQFDAAQIVQ